MCKSAEINQRLDDYGFESYLITHAHQDGIVEYSRRKQLRSGMTICVSYKKDTRSELVVHSTHCYMLDRHGYRYNLEGINDLAQLKQMYRLWAGEKLELVH